MTRDELASALQFQAAELIPIPLDDAVLDFAILGPASPGDGGEPRMQVLLAAVQEATVLRLVAAVEAGGLQVARGRPRSARAHPSARAPGARSRAGRRRRRRRRRRRGRRRARRAAPGAEGIVSFGGGVTAIAVHEDRRPAVRARARHRWPRAHRRDRDRPRPAARDRRGVEAPARRRPGRHDELVARARTSIERPLSVLLDEVRSSIDYYRNQPGSSPLLRIVATGGAAQLPGLHRAPVGARRRAGRARPSMRELVALGDIGFADEELPRLDPYLPAAVGLALGGAGVGTVIDLLPRTRRNAVTKRRPQISTEGDRGRRRVRRCCSAASRSWRTRASRARSRSAPRSRPQVAARAASSSTALQPILDRREPDQRRSQANLQTLLATDVAWQTMIDRITREPPGRRLAHVVHGSGHAARARSRPAAPAPTSADGTSSSSSSSSSDDDDHDRCRRRRRRRRSAGTITFQGIGEGLPDARGVDRRDGQGPADRGRLRHHRAEGRRRRTTASAAAASRSPRPRCRHAGRAEQPSETSS